MLSKLIQRTLQFRAFNSSSPAVTTRLLTPFFPLLSLGFLHAVRFGSANVGFFSNLTTEIFIFFTNWFFESPFEFGVQCFGRLSAMRVFIFLLWIGGQIVTIFCGFNFNPFYEVEIKIGL